MVFFSRANQVGMLFVGLFITCFAWYWIHPVHRELHTQLMELSFIGFSGMNAWSFLIGAIQVYMWGILGTGLWFLVEKLSSRS